MCISCASTELVFFRIYTEERLKPAEFLGFILLRKMAFFFFREPCIAVSEQWVLCILLEKGAFT